MHACTCIITDNCSWQESTCCTYTCTMNVHGKRALAVYMYMYNEYACSLCFSIIFLLISDGMAVSIPLPSTPEEGGGALLAGPSSSSPPGGGRGLAVMSDDAKTIRELREMLTNSMATREKAETSNMVRENQWLIVLHVSGVIVVLCCIMLPCLLYRTLCMYTCTCTCTCIYTCTCTMYMHVPYMYIILLRVYLDMLRVC